MKSKIFVNLRAIILGLVISLGIGYVVAWTGPTDVPPNGNVAVPINVGGRDGVDTAKWYTQTKTGILNLAHLITPDLTVTNPDVVSPVTPGQVLTALDSTGRVGWASGGSSCTVNSTSQLGSLSGTSGNNAYVIKLITILQPGTYTFTGTGHSYDAGGGGVDAVFLSSSYYSDGVKTSTEANAITEVNSYRGTSNSSVTTPNITYGSGDPIIYAIKRSGANDTAWTIPANTTVTVTSQKYVYLVLSQASETGYVNITGSASSCSGASSSAGSVGGGCYTTSSVMGADYVVAGAVYAAWGNASTTHTTFATAANTDNDSTACICPAGYSSRITGQNIGAGETGGNGKYVTGSGSYRPSFDMVFMCVKD